ncbi:hypothetical protein Tco_1355332 [Tanacetum coccineum]
MGKEKMKESVPRDLPPTPFLEHLNEQMGSPYRTCETVHMIRNPEEIHNEKAHEDKRDMDVGWDITSKDVESVIVREKEQDYDIPLNDSVVQPLTPQMIHITQPDDDYVAPATNPMSNKQLNKFEEEFSYITKDPGARRHLSRTARLIIMWIKRLLDDLEVIAAQVRVTTASTKIVKKICY